MYKCKYCSRSYVWKQSLKRHVQQSHWDEASEEYDDTNADMSDDSSQSQQSDVDDISYKSSGDESRNENDGDVNGSKSEGNVDDSGDDNGTESDSASEDGDDDEALWIHVIEDIVRRFKTQHEQKLQHYEAADPLELTAEAMYPIYKRALKQCIGKQLVFDFQLRRSGYYKKLERDLKKFTKKHSLLRAVRATLRKNDNILEEMLDDYDEHKAFKKEHDEEMDATVDTNSDLAAGTT